MLIKEYHIPLPLSVEEYRVAQLYMIAKKSREESEGKESGVEILVNEPYSDGPGSEGQYTHKIYHVGRHLPVWLKAVLPKSALIVDEEAWNAYPYTKTRYTCPFYPKFFIEIETKYFNDDGRQENVFNLNKEELAQRTIDVIDIVKDQLCGSDYVEGEDPTKYVSKSTGRGPLSSNWIEEYFEEKDKNIMCAYKLCRVEFKFWGMQGRIEQFVHDSALRRVMLRAHRQAWAWQDEWIGLTMDDIRRLEKETQEHLARTMANCAGEGEEGGEGTSAGDEVENAGASIAIEQQKSADRSNKYKVIETSCKQSIKSTEAPRIPAEVGSSDDEFVDAE